MSRMQVSREAMPVAPHLRKRFFTWSLAVVGSLTSTGMVVLPPAAAWAQEDATPGQEKKSTPEDSKAEDTDKAPLDQKQFRQMLSDGQLDELAKKLDEAIAEDPDNSSFVNMNTTLSMYLARSKPKVAKERLTAQIEKLLAMDKLDASGKSALGASTSYLVRIDQELDIDGKLALIDRVMDRLYTSKDLASTVRPLVSTRSSLLLEADRADEAKQFLDKILDQQRSRIDAESGKGAAPFITFASLYASSLSDAFPEATDAVLDEAEALALLAIDREGARAKDFSALYNLKSSTISRLSYTDAKRADELLSGLEAKLEELKERLEEDDAKQLASYESNLGRLRSRLETALAREALIGTKAPAIDADAFVAMDEVTMDDLKGKVVLIDFWAVWCGPCIATFPHLIEWHEQYADQGLVILGATRYYSYAWDEEADKATRSEDVERDAELAMLEKFRESHGLHHGFFVSGKDSEYSKQFHVSGIPQAVLIDKEGKIQMIRVGSGDANAKALHAKIEELLH